MNSIILQNITRYDTNLCKKVRLTSKNKSKIELEYIEIQDYLRIFKYLDIDFYVYKYQINENSNLKLNKENSVIFYTKNFTYRIIESDWKSSKLITFKNLVAVIYYKNNQIHRNDKPAAISYSENGEIYEEIWYQNDKYHRTDGPAFICYENNQIYYEKWFQEDKLHRIGGPAVIRYFCTGEIMGQEFWQNGIKINHN